MDQPVVLNEELPKKYESYSSSASTKANTLDEPVIDTIVLPFPPRKEMPWRSTSKSEPPSEGDRKTIRK